MKVELNKEYKAEMRRAVRRGVKALDGWFGRNVWPKQIKLTRLHMESGCQCVIGQLFEQSDYNARSFNAKIGSPANVIYNQEFGFDYTLNYKNGAALQHGSNDVIKYVNEAYAELKRLWQQVIRRRKGLVKRG